MANVVTDVVVGATRKRLSVTIVDANGIPVDLTGVGSNIPRLQGRSTELTGINIDLQGVIIQASQGRVDFLSMGSLVSHAQLAGNTPPLDAATFSTRVKWWDSTGAFDWGDIIMVRFVDTPLGT